MSDVVIGRLTRRGLLVCGGAAAAYASLSGPLVRRAIAGPSWLSRSSYTGRVGQAFTAQPPGAPATSLKLLTVEDLLGTSPAGRSLASRDDAFLLRFEWTAGPRFAQGLVDLRNKELGRASLFVVPDRGDGYALVVNRCA